MIGHSLRLRAGAPRKLPCLPHRTPNIASNWVFAIPCPRLRRFSIVRGSHQSSLLGTTKTPDLPRIDNSIPLNPVKETLLKSTETLNHKHSKPISHIKLTQKPGSDGSSTTKGKQKKQMDSVLPTVPENAALQNAESPSDGPAVGSSASTPETSSLDEKNVVGVTTGSASSVKALRRRRQKLRKKVLAVEKAREMDALSSQPVGGDGSGNCPANGPESVPENIPESPKQGPKDGSAPVASQVPKKSTANPQPTRPKTKKPLRIIRVRTEGYTGSESSADTLLADLDHTPSLARMPQLEQALGISRHKAPSGSPNGLTMTVAPTSSVREDLVSRLKLISKERGKLVTKKVLMELLDSNAFTSAAKAIIMKKLRASLLTQSVPHIEDVLEAVASTGSFLDESTPESSSIKDAMQGRGPRSASRNDSKGESRVPKKGLAKSLKSSIQSLVSPQYTHSEIKSINSRDLNLTPHEMEQPPVPTLAYGLERALFNPGVYHLRDPRSRVFNFDPYLQTIMPVGDFDFTALKEYITSSRDEALIGTAAKLEKKYTGSTSSMTGVLAHFHYLLSQWREPRVDNLSKGFPAEPRSFSAMQRAPAAIFLRYKDGVYAIDADKQFDTPNILAMLGKSMEKLLTLPIEDFKKYHKDRSHEITAEERDEAESYHYTTQGDFLMRSQLDAYDPRLPGTGMFDLKTRAVVSIRMDAKNYEQGMGYEIRNRTGDFHSYEREYFDMIRSAFLKYSLQVRMGRMDGIYVAFHNTERIFGFQYINLSEMDFALHGTEDTTIGNEEFKLSLEILNRALDRATTKYPGQSLQLHFETRESELVPFMYIFATPVTEEEIDQLQNRNKQAYIKFERTVLGLHGGEAASSEEVEVDEKEVVAKTEWEALQAQVEEQIEVEEMVDEETGSEEASDEDGANVTELDLSEEEEEADRRLDELLKSVIPEEEKTKDAGITTEGELASQPSGAQDGSQDSGINEASTSSIIEGQEDKAAKSDDEVETNNDSIIEEQAEEARTPEQQVVSTKTSEPQLKTSSADGGEPRSNLASEKKGSKPFAPTKQPGYPAEDEDLLAMYLTIRNKVDGKYVRRPENLNKEQKWTVEYGLAQIPTDSKGRTLYNSTLKRRAKTHLSDARDQQSNFRTKYLAELAKYVAEGKSFRKKENERDAVEGLTIYEEGISNKTLPTDLATATSDGV